MPNPLVRRGLQTAVAVMLGAIAAYAQGGNEGGNKTRPKNCRGSCAYNLAWKQNKGPKRLNVHLATQDGVEIGRLQVKATGTPTVIFANHLKGHICIVSASWLPLDNKGVPVGNGTDSAEGDVASGEEGQFQGERLVPPGGRIILFTAGVSCSLPGQLR
jgi:hypothetical protein